MKYEYIAKTKDSRTLKGVEEVRTKDELVVKLRAKGLFIISVKEAGAGREASGNFPFARRKGKRSSVKLYDLAFFARNLATTLSSGVTLLRSLEIIARQAESLKLEKVITTCCNDIKAGLAFGDAVAKHKSVFPPLWVSVARVGEASGNLPFVLDKLADYLELRMDFERKIKSAMVYPCILLGAGTIAIFAFLKFIFPKFSKIFQQFDIELPVATKIVFFLSDLVAKNSLYLAGGVVALIFLFISFRKRPAGKEFVDKMTLKLPIFGEVIFLSLLERLTSTVSILLESGLPLVYTLEVSAHGIGNSILEKRLLIVGQKVRDGNSLSQELSKEGIFPLLVSEMAKIGEETGTMPDVFKKISEHYRKEVSTKVERFISAFEPLMIVFMGVIIGGIVIALFLPLFKISTLGT